MHMVRPEIARRKPLSLMYLGSAALGHAFQDDTCHGEASRMGQRQGDPRRAHARGDFCGASVELDAGTSTGFADDFDLQPAHAMADTGSQGFRSRFLGGKAGGKTLGGIALAQAVCLLCRGVDTIEEALAKAFHRLLNARNLNQVNAAADDHAEYQANISFDRDAGGVAPLYR